MRAHGKRRDVASTVPGASTETCFQASLLTGRQPPPPIPLAEASDCRCGERPESCRSHGGVCARARACVCVCVHAHRVGKLCHQRELKQAQCEWQQRRQSPRGSWTRPPHPALDLPPSMQACAEASCLCLQPPSHSSGPASRGSPGWPVLRHPPFLGTCWLDSGVWSPTVLSHTLAPPLRHCVTLSKHQTPLEPPFPTCEVRMIVSLPQVGCEAEIQQVLSERFHVPA